LRRTTRQKGILSQKDLENIEIRASSAFGEMQQAWRFDHVIVNHDGEDSDHWDAFYHPIGDARSTLQAFAALLSGEPIDSVEGWEQDLLG
jgi:guanylate kinase